MQDAAFVGLSAKIYILLLYYFLKELQAEDIINIQLLQDQLSILENNTTDHTLLRYNLIVSHTVLQQSPSLDLPSAINL